MPCRTTTTALTIPSIISAALVLTLWVPSLAGAQMHVHAGGGLPHNIPDFCASPTLQSMTNGSWSNPLTWSGGRVPRAGDRVLVAAGTTVTFDTVSNDALTCVSVKGRLNFQTSSNTRLTVGTLMVMEGGYLWIGDSSTPVSASALAEIVIANQPLNTSTDPEQYGTGFLAFGKVTIHGAVRSPSFVRVSTEPRAGQTSLSLSATPSGWRSGDRVIVPDTRHLKWNEINTSYQPQWEERTLSNVSGTGVTLTASLSHDHLGARNQDGDLEFLPHVGNLTRNVVIRSASPSGVRGHVIFTHRAEIDVRYAAFRDLGRTTVASLDSTTFNDAGQVTRIGTNQIGRYSIHLHHLMGPATPNASGYQFTLVGNAIDGGTKWGIAIHNSHYGLVQNNVIYNVNGAALMTEDGNESYNVIDGNFAVRGTGQGGRDAGGREGTGFYFKGPLNYVRNNVASNFMPGGAADASYGFKYFLVYLGNIKVPTVRGADVNNATQWTTRDGNATPVLQFDNNEVYGATESGLTYWWIGTFGSGYIRDTPRSVLKNTRVWHVYNKGVFSYETSNLTLDGITIRGKDPANAACCGVGIEGMDYQSDGWIIRNANIQGMKTGISPSASNGRTVQIIEHSYLRNQTNISVGTLWTSGSRADWIQPRRLIVFDTVLAAPSGGSYSAIDMSYGSTSTRNLVQRDEVVVLNHNRVSGDNFQVHYLEQSPSFIVPRTELNGDGTPRVAGAPVAGLTNSQAWASYRVAIAGQVAPCSTTRPGIHGFVCPTSVTYSSPPPSQTPPPPPPTDPPPSGGDTGGSGGGTTTPPSTTTPTTPPPPPPPSSDEDPWVSGDFDGDGIADLNLFRVATNTWYSISATSAYKAGVTTAWGAPGDVPVAGDYDGDKKLDVAVFRPSTGGWYIRTSTSNLTQTISYTLGVSNDVPVPADYDGDGRTDVAVFRRSNGKWYIRTSSSNFGQVTEASFGAGGDVPAPADFDGDGRADLAVFRPSNRTWYIKRSANGTSLTQKFGQSTDTPVPADYDGDGKADVAMYSTGVSGWNVLTSSSNFRKELFRASGRKGDQPVRMDYNGDGKTDFIAFHATSGSWYALTSTAPFQTGSLLCRWGQNGDVPVPAVPKR